MPVISRIWARSALISAGLQPQQETGTRATGQRNWPTHPAVPPGTDDQNSTPARELEPPQPLLRSLDGGQHPCAKIGASTPATRRLRWLHSGSLRPVSVQVQAQIAPQRSRNFGLGHLRGRQDPTGVRALADRFDVDLTRPLRSLSKGNRQKVALVLAFMGEPELILLDEPTSGLDPLVQQEFHALVRERAAEGSSVLLSSHVLAEVQRMADRVGILRRGRLVAVESLADLRAKAVHHVSARFTHAVPREAFADLPGLRDLTVQGAAMRCGAPEASLDRIVKAIARFEVVDLTCQEADLEETFLAFYGQEDVDAAHHHPQDPARPARRTRHGFTSPAGHRACGNRPTVASLTAAGTRMVTAIRSKKRGRDDPRQVLTLTCRARSLTAGTP